MVDVAPPGSAASESVTASTEDAEYTEDFFDSAEFLEEEEEEGEEEEERFISIFEILDAPRELPEPVELTEEHLKQVADELGIITLCWPELEGVEFENRVNFPMSYLKNSDKEKLLLLYAENFRRQFVHQYPDRKQLMLACENECGVQKMVCTTIRSTTLPYPEIETWQDCASFIGDHMKYEPLQIPTLFDKGLFHQSLFRQLVEIYLNVFWKCSKTNCPGSPTTNADISELLKVNKQHNCEPDIAKNDVEVCIFKAKKSVPDFSSIKTALYRSRNQALGIASLPKHRENIVIPPMYQEFLLIDDGAQDRILVFAKDGGRLLRNAKKFFEDGIFQSCCPLFTQLYTIHVDIGSTSLTTNVVPAVYVLLPNKSKYTYISLFKMLKARVLTRKIYI